MKLKNKRLFLLPLVVTSLLCGCAKIPDLTTEEGASEAVDALVQFVSEEANMESVAASVNQMGEQAVEGIQGAANAINDVLGITSAASENGTFATPTTTEVTTTEVATTEGVPSAEELLAKYPEQGEAYVVLPTTFLTKEDLAIEHQEVYAPLDALGRCGTAMAVIEADTLPTEERGSIGHIKPSGWKQAKYDGVVNSNPGYLYNRCHLIAFCLAGENDNVCNLITGTRYMNVEGMLPWEEKCAKYMDEHPSGKITYRVTPLFVDEELVARGVLMEAVSRDGVINFCVLAYNMQPGVSIDYATGASHLNK